MENLPKDVLTLLLLDLDIDSVISMCQTSSKFKNKICLNDYFWMNKLSHDFGLNSDLKSAKKEYFEAYNILKTDPISFYNKGIFTNNIKMVKLGLAYGAEVNYMSHGTLTPLMYSLFRGYDEIFDYLADKAVSDQSTFILNVRGFIDFYDNKKETLTKFFSHFIPKNIKYFNNKEFKQSLLLKFTEAYKNDQKHANSKFYNEWIDYYRQLAQ